MLSTFSRDKLSARKGWWKHFPTFGQGDAFVLPLSHAFGPRCAESITSPGAFSMPAHLYCTSLQSLSWPRLRSLFLPWVSESHHLFYTVQTHWHLLGQREMTDGNWAACLHKGCVWLHLQAGVCRTPAAATEWDGAKQQQERYWEPRLTRFIKLTTINKALLPINCLPMTHTIAFAIMAIKRIISTSYHDFSLSPFSA